jgi:hypothetical protein
MSLCYSAASPFVMNDCVLLPFKFLMCVDCAGSAKTNKTPTAKSVDDMQEHNASVVCVLQYAKEGALRQVIVSFYYIADCIVDRFESTTGLRAVVRVMIFLFSSSNLVTTCWRRHILPLS